MNKASRATINLSKTKVLPINTDQINYLQNQLPGITIRDRYETIKILGISFCEGLKQTAFINWQKILQKMQNHINKFYPRNLSLLGKGIILNTLILAKTAFLSSIILNTLILAKTAFLSNVFPIPNKILTKLHKKIFWSIWQDKKTEPIATETLSLPQKRGGINIKEPDTHNIAMRLKHTLNLKYKENPPPWTYLVTYWLAKDINKFGKDFKYLKSNNRIKTIYQETPFYYNDLIQYIKT